MECCKVNHDLTMNNIINNSLCNCGQIETAFHYFFKCPRYTIIRNGILYREHETGSVPILTLSRLSILNGDTTLSEQANFELDTALSNVFRKPIVLNHIIY